jgi:hypothetical protein
MPVHFSWKDRIIPGNLPIPGANSIMERILSDPDEGVRTKNKVKDVLESVKKGELLGAGASSLCFDIGGEKVQYITTDSFKFRYLNRYLNIADKDSYFTITQFDGDRDLFFFTAKRLYQLHELSNKSEARKWSGRIDRLVKVFKAAIAVKPENDMVIWLVKEEFGKLCDEILEIDDDGKWKMPLLILHRRSIKEKPSFLGLVLDLREDDILFNKEGSINYIVDPFSYKNTMLLLQGGNSKHLSKDQTGKLIELFAGYIVYGKFNYQELLSRIKYILMAYNYVNA